MTGSTLRRSGARQDAERRFQFFSSMSVIGHFGEQMLGKQLTEVAVADHGPIGRCDLKLAPQEQNVAKRDERAWSVVVLCDDLALTPLPNDVL